ncbi:hypothetical protein SLA2020_179350 [Shorea laevis]
MRKGAKRKATQKDDAKPSPSSQEDQKEIQKAAPPAKRGKARSKAEPEDEVKASSSSQENQKESQKEAAPRAKRVKAAVKPKPEPEYFEDKRNMEDLWKTAFPVGTEWDQLDTLYKFNWNFSNLEEAFEEGGKLYGNKVYLFVSTEPQLVPYKEENKLICIPVVVTVVSPVPPSDKIGINSVQREAEEIVPMKQMKMDWVPYMPLEDRDSQVDRMKSQIFILSCTQRRTALKHLKIDRLKKYEYCLPYFYDPLKEDELEQSTVVQIFFPLEPPVVCEFDWEFDEVDEFTDKLVEEEALPVDQKDAFKEFVEEKVREAKKANREARQARKKAREEMSEEIKAAFQNMKFYKFYPVKTADTPDVSQVKSPFINRYYGKAHEVF